MPKMYDWSFWSVVFLILALNACNGGSGNSGDAGSSGGEAGTGTGDGTDLSTSTDTQTGTGTGNDTGSGTSSIDTDTSTSTETVPFGTPCEHNTECAATGQLCHPLDKLCVDCLLGVNCAAGQLCEENRCVATVSCDNSLDCVGASGDKKICDASRSICVQCVQATDCEEANDCINNVCVPYDACINTLDCSGGTVCDIAAGRCRECIQDGDCDEGMRCVWNRCVQGCNSDNDCTPLGMLCDIQAGYCVSCMRHEDCPTGTHCENGACEINLCEPGQRSCTNNTLMQCAESGAEFETLNACGSRETCVVTGTDAQCRPWVCTPGETECDERKVITCSADGFSVTSSIDCELRGEYCIRGACSTQLCEPENLLCMDGDVVRCSEDGLSTTVEDACGEGEYCDDTEDPECRTQICTPDAPACNDDVATTCNSDGSGYLSGGTTCVSPDVCIQGTCTDAEPCGNTYCPGESCVELLAGSTPVCAYLTDKDATTTRAGAEAACSTLGTGWAICPSAQICLSAVYTYLTERGCDCSGDAASCRASTTGQYVHLHSSNSTTSVVRTSFVPGTPPCTPLLPSPYPAIGTCGVVTSVTTAAVLCCN